MCVDSVSFPHSADSGVSFPHCRFRCHFPTLQIQECHFPPLQIQECHFSTLGVSFSHCWFGSVIYPLSIFRMTGVSFPHSADLGGSFPHSADSGVSFPHSADSRVSCPHSAGSGVSCPHSAGSGVSCPHSAGSGVSCPHSAYSGVSCPHSADSGVSFPHIQECYVPTLQIQECHIPTLQIQESRVPTLQIQECHFAALLLCRVGMESMSSPFSCLHVTACLPVQGVMRQARPQHGLPAGAAAAADWAAGPGRVGGRPAGDTADGRLWHHQGWLRQHPGDQQVAQQPRPPGSPRLQGMVAVWKVWGGGGGVGGGGCVWGGGGGGGGVLAVVGKGDHRAVYTSADFQAGHRIVLHQGSWKSWICAYLQSMTTDFIHLLGLNSVREIDSFKICSKEWKYPLKIVGVDDWCNKQQGHMQCHSDSVTRMSSSVLIGCSCSLCPITWAVSECEHWLRAFIAVAPKKNMANLYTKPKALWRFGHCG